MLLSATANSAAVSISPLGLQDIFLRFLCALIVGLIIGIEREYTHRPAGMRTHILVSLGACTVMIVGQMIFQQYHPLGASSDPARLSAQVISGVGFLGAGTILREGANVKGLTTAASLWTVGGLGIAAGGGYYGVAIIGTIFMFATLTVFELLQHLLINPHSGHRKYTIDTDDFSSALKAINTAAAQYQCEIRNIEAENLSNGTHRISFQGEFGRGKQKSRRIGFFETLASHCAILSIRSSDEAVASK